MRWHGSSLLALLNDSAEPDTSKGEPGDASALIGTTRRVNFHEQISQFGLIKYNGKLEVQKAC